MKVSELNGAQLDYWVAKAEGKKVRIIPSGSYPYDDKETEIFFHQEPDGYLYPGGIGLITAEDCPLLYTPSTDWSQGGPIIEREKIKLEPIHSLRGGDFVCWNAKALKYIFPMDGETALIAAMRCKVANTFGLEVSE